MADVTIRPDMPAATAAEAGYHLDVRCLRCRHQQLLPPGAYGDAGQRPLNRLAPILRCTGCGARGQVRVWVAELRQ